MGVTNAGKAAAAGIICGVGSVTEFDYIATGTGTTAFAATQTALVTEVTDSGLERVQVTPTLTITSVTNDTAQWTTSFSVTATVTVAEVGIFNHASAGTMLVRNTTSKSLENGDTYTPIVQLACA